MTEYYRLSGWVLSLSTTDFRGGDYDTVLQTFGVGIMTQYYRLSGWVL